MNRRNIILAALLALIGAWEVWPVRYTETSSGFMLTLRHSGCAVNAFGHWFTILVRLKGQGAWTAIDLL
jgi:hypothetical protein